MLSYGENFRGGVWLEQRKACPISNTEFVMLCIYPQLK